MTTSPHVQVEPVAQLVRLPEHWPAWAVALLAMLLLAALDFLGAVAAKEWADHRVPLVLVVGLVLAAALFLVYAASLQYADLSTVTFGWVVMLQVGVVLLDRFRYDVEVPPGSWVAMGVLLLAQGYLLLAPSLAAGRS